MYFNICDMQFLSTVDSSEDKDQKQAEAKKPH